MRSYPLSILTEEYYWMWPSVNVKHEPSIIVNALSQDASSKPKSYGVTWAQRLKRARYPQTDRKPSLNTGFPSQISILWALLG